MSYPVPDNQALCLQHFNCTLKVTSCHSLSAHRFVSRSVSCISMYFLSFTHCEIGSFNFLEIPQPQHSQDFVVLVPSTAGLHLKGLLLPFPDGRSCEARPPCENAIASHSLLRVNNKSNQLNLHLTSRNVQLTHLSLYTYNSAKVWR